MSEENLQAILSQLAGKIKPSVYGPEYIDLSHGLHFSGGEPFLNFDLLCRAVEVAEELKIPSTFVETNGFWASDDNTTREMLHLLKSKGLKGIMISINPFYLEYVPFEKTRRAIEIGYEVFGEAMVPYQLEYYQKFCEWGIEGTLTFEQFLKYETKENFARTAEFFLTGRSAYTIENYLPEFFPRYKAEQLVKQPCSPEFIRPWHNHFDNYCNFMPGYCGGISLGDVRELGTMLKDGIEVQNNSVLYFLMKNEFSGLLNLAEDLGYVQASEGYLSKCHLCADIRKHLSRSGDFPELQPTYFYDAIDA